MGERFWRENRRALRLWWCATGLAWLAAALWLAFLVLLGAVVSRVFVGQQTLSDVAPAFAVLVALAGARAALLWISEVLGQGAAGGVKQDLRRRLAGHLIALGPGYTRGARSGDLVHVLTQGVESLDEYITQFLPARLLAALVPALVLLVVALLDPWTLPVLLFAGPLLVVLLALIGARTRDLTRRREAELAWMSAHFLDLLRGMTTLKLFGRSRDQTATIGAIGQRYGDTMMGVLRTAFQTSLVLEWGATAATALVAIEVSFRLMHGLMPFERALAVLLVTPEFFLPLRQLALKYHAGTAGKAGAERLYALLDTPLRTAVPATTGARPPARLDLRFEDVHLAYEGGRRVGPSGVHSPPLRRPALAGLSLDVAQGQTVALVGATGAGKSTVAGLLLRFVEPDRGTITVGGVPLREIDPARWRRQVAWVPQHPHLFHGTVADNLRLAKPDASAAELLGAARAAHADELIAGLPQGYDTPLGEGGARLSGGQAQRLALARAFLKADAAGADTRDCPPWGAPLLILDEPTSHLDEANEAGIREALERLSERRTVLLISHRPALVAVAHQVALMAGGRVVQTSLNRPRWDPDPAPPGLQAVGAVPTPSEVGRYARSTSAGAPGGGRG